MTHDVAAELAPVPTPEKRTPQHPNLTRTAGWLLLLLLLLFV